MNGEQIRRLVRAELHRVDIPALKESEEFKRVRDDLYEKGGNWDDDAALYETLRRRIWKRLHDKV